MAVTDLTDSLPWWARNGSGAAQGPGATGTPSAAPQGAGGPPGSGDSASWLQYLVQMFGPQQAMAMMQGGANPADMPSANAQNVNMVDLTNTGNGGGGGFNPPPGPAPNPHGDGPPPPPPPVVGNPPAPITSQTPPAGPSLLPQARGASNPPGPMSPGATTMAPPAPPTPAGSSILPQARGAAVQPGPMSPGSTTMAAPTGPTPAAPVPGPLASGGAGGVGATSNPRFVGLDYQPNASPQNSMRGGPQSTALNLAGLFNRGQPAVNPSAPAANAQPVSAQRPVPGPLAGGGMVPSTYPGDNWDIDAQGNVVPNYGGPSTTGPLQRPPKSSVARARILAPNYYG